MDQRIRQSFGKQGMMQTLGAKVTSIREGQVIITAPIQPLASQQHGFAHAGMVFALGDSAAGYSALTVMPEDAEVLTAEMKINLVAPSNGQRLVATGEVVKPGRRLVVTRATVETEYADGTRKVVAILQGTMVPVT
ncbi:PaaI family thioesterase [Nioella nitratireducens]|uniref:PaaI family thioesterase n=1 Tax=Nioella nitratireducens TaxID=1287720 RepID=UPI0008FD3190|nr:PaaI family thioesterase [Nioella nitratireducens]